MAFTTGNDINVYLHAAQQLYLGKNIYEANPYNNYLYSPLFALLLQSLTHLDWVIARFIWMLINAILVFRLWKILIQLIDPHFSNIKKYKLWLGIGVAFISFGFLNHNLILGQVTVLLLWLTCEGIFQIMSGHTIRGSLLLALGINIKIIPVLALYYLILKQKYSSIAITILFVVISLYLPAPLIGFKYNNHLLHEWALKINSSSEKFVFENNDGCQSLSCILPAYFYSFDVISLRGVKDYNPEDHGYQRMILNVPYKSLVLVLQGLRILLFLSIIPIILHRRKNRMFTNIYFFWEIAYLLLMSLLFFPHQMKYSMFYFVPAAVYMILYVTILYSSPVKRSLKEKVIGFFSFIIITLLAISGRDIIGNKWVNLLDYYHFMGICIILFLVILQFCPPSRLEDRMKKNTAIIEV